MGGFLGAIMGGLDGFLYALIACMIIDYITGIMVAVTDKNISSKVGFKGILKKFCIVAIVSFAYIIDSKVIGSGEVIRTATICFYISNEGISILENAGNMGLPLPKKLKEVLTQIHSEDD